MSFFNHEDPYHTDNSQNSTNSLDNQNFGSSEFNTNSNFNSNSDFDSFAQNRDMQDEMQRFVGDSNVLSAKMYNALIGAHLIYGIILTGFICTFMSRFFAASYFEHPYIFTILFLLVSVGGSRIAAHESYGLSLLGYTIVIFGFASMTATVIPFFAMPIILFAAGMTTLIMLIMTVCAFVFPKAFEGMGRALVTSLLALIVAEVIAMLIGFHTNLFSIIGLFIFTLYIGYDWAKGQRYRKTANYAVITAMELYMDVINIFIRILSLAGRRR